MNKNILLKTAVFSGLLISGLLFCVCFMQYLPLSRELLQAGLSDNIRTISLLSEPQIKKAVYSNDDISLLIQIENLARTEGVSAAYVLDSSGRVTVHNQTGEWGRIYDSRLHSAAVLSDGPLVQEKPGGRELVYSSPVASSATLFVELSRQKVNDYRARTYRNAVLTSAAALVISVVLIMFFMYAEVYSPLRKTIQMLKAVSPGSRARIEQDKRNEYGMLAGAVNEAVDRFEKERERLADRIEETRIESSLLIRAALGGRCQGVVIVDSENRIIAVDQKAAKLFSIDEKTSVGRHVLDVFSAKEVVDLIQASLSAGPGSVLTGVLGGTGTGIRCTSVPGTGNRAAGTILNVTVD